MTTYGPGTIVSALLDGNEIVGVTARCGRMYYADSVGYGWVRLADVGNVRPLVVIDPEDPEQLDRLLEMVLPYADLHAPELLDALLAFANPTPPEPEPPARTLDDLYDLLVNPTPTMASAMEREIQRLHGKAGS